MWPVLSVAQMREVDQKAIGRDTAIGYRFMRKAGLGLLRAAREMVRDPSSGEIAVVCGKGNNAGDGYVAGRLLMGEGYRVMCFSVVPLEELRNECLIACREYLDCRGNMLVLNDVADFPHPSRFRLVIDALLGTGIKGDPHGLYAAVIERINSSRVPVLAADTPSGLDNDTGRPGSPCIKATVTIAMGYSKTGQYFYPGREFVGRLRIEDLNYPDEIVFGAMPALFCPTSEALRKMLPRRHPAGSKFEHGQALLIGGSPGMTGSITMASEAAMRCGCGMVHCGFPRPLSEILSIKLTEPVLHPLPHAGEGVLGGGAAERVLELCSGMQALCIGPGLSHEPETSHEARKIVAGCTIPTILDADGINAFKSRTEQLKREAGNLLLTPHHGEFERLFGPLPVTPLERISLLNDTARRLGIAILLKGNPSLLSLPEGKTTILPYGNSALAKAGSGDVLSGIITAFAAQGMPVADAAILGAYIHGTAGERASRALGEYSVTARDVIGCISRSIATLA